MKKRIIISLATVGLLLSPAALVQSAEIIEGSEVQVKETTTQSVPVVTNTPGTIAAPITVTRDVKYQGSDSLAVGDPLGGGPVTSKDDAGPPLTRVTPYGPGCGTDLCNRANTRWSSTGTTWEHDRATGLSLGWGGGSRQAPAKSSSYY